MAIGPLCIPTLRQEVLKLRQADILEDADTRRLEVLARDAVECPAPDSSAHRAEAGQRARHRPMRPAHTH